MADEIGLDSKTLHTHIFICCKSPVYFTRIKKLFPEAHIETAQGTPAENRDYITKTGKWENDPKADTSIPGTFEEWGELPAEQGQGFRSDIAAIYQQISDGLTNAEIMALNPATADKIGKMDKIRQDILESRYRDTWRDLTVTYIFGATGTGKTRSVMEKEGYSAVYRVTDYQHAFDRYAQEPVLCLDEFRSSLSIGDMLNFCDGYPVSLPARYANRVACYERVYLISNIDLKRQYPLVQVNDPETWQAFLRRIHSVIEFCRDGTIIDHGTAIDYVFPLQSPWDDETEKGDTDDAEQIAL